MQTILTMAFMLVPSMLWVWQTGGIEWRPENISLADRDAILALSRQMGIEPRRISLLQLEPMSIACHFVLVESSVTEEGNHRTWFELSLRPKTSQCFRPPAGVGIKSVGPWIALSSGLEKREEWRIRDNEWHIDVSLRDGVPYSDAELVVLAIRRGELINHFSKSTGPLDVAAKLSEINVDTITAVEKNPTGIRTYRVRTGKENGLILGVRILNGSVELDSYGTWGVER